MRTALLELQELQTSHGKLRPALSTRTFQIAGDDFGAAVILPRLMATLREQAPAVRIAWRSYDRNAMALAIEKGEVDFAVAVLPDPLSSLRSASLVDDEFVCMVSSMHPLIRGSLSLEQHAAASHIVVTQQGDFHGFYDRLLEAQGLSRKVVLSQPFQMTLWLLVAESDLIVTLPTRIAAVCASPRVERYALPLVNAGFTEKLYWHRRHEHDVMHQWIRARFIDVAESLS